ncbi:DeoR/GlpR family DNA-binding transcription regulator [Streptomyces sp. NBC_01525]|uniref:DeoR/GlpR family DNA-binding transcription regulator n=1 Tax=Streptomyces sp. NBC_01525 TaxID=2903893 RepID=UPI00386D0D06
MTDSEGNRTSVTDKGPLGRAPETERPGPAGGRRGPETDRPDPEDGRANPEANPQAPEPKGDRPQGDAGRAGAAGTAGAADQPGTPGQPDATGQPGTPRRPDAADRTTPANPVPEAAADAPAAKLTPRERRKRIADRVLAEGQVTIEELVQELGVSQMTVHRDLDTLEHQGWLRKVRGGATAAPNALFESNARWRGNEQVAAKEAICAAALAIAEPGQAVIIDDSSTALPLARALSSRGAYTVITNSLQVINELAEEPDIRVIALGGEYHAAFNAFLGMSTADSARSFRADVAFLSTSAVDNGHCYHQAQENVLVKRALMAAARRKVLLVDHSKFGRQALYELAPLADFDLVISDTQLPQEEQDALQSLGVRYELVSEEPHRA